MRILLALVLLAVTAFCAFGFLATYAPVEGARVWRTGYGTAIAGCLYGFLRLGRAGQRGD